MKLLMFTRKVDLDDHRMGFTHYWIETLAKKIDFLYVVCLASGRHNLPKNVKLITLGKEHKSGTKHKNRLMMLIKSQLIFSKIIPKIDGIFCHMMPLYVILVSFFAKIYRKKIIMWMALDNEALNKIGIKLKIAELQCYKIITASPESYDRKTHKKIVTGHGIDVEQFIDKHEQRDSNLIISIGRITPVKRCEDIIKAFDLLVNKKDKKSLKLEFYGGWEGEEKYYKQLIMLVKKFKLEKNILFKGPISNSKTVKLYNKAEVFINSQKRGGAGKSVLEAMASGCIPLICTNTFNKLLSKNSKKMIIYNEGNINELANKLNYIIRLNNTKKEKIRKELEKFVLENHNINKLMNKLIILYTIRGRK